MPRYLGIDYLAEYLREKHRKQEEVLKLKLPNPDHLEVQGAYPHRGVLADETYRRPWQRVNFEKHRLEVKDGDNKREGFLPILGSFKQLEALSSDYDKSLLEDDSFEVVPSSNPESQDFSELEVPDRKRKETDEIISEQFVPFDLGDVQLRGTTEDFLVEELQGADHLDYFRRYLPSVKILLRRVRPLTLEDPLRSDEHQFFQKDRRYVLNDPSEERPSKPLETETFSKEEILTLECELSEEKLLPPSTDIPERSCLDVCIQDLEKTLDGLPKQTPEEGNDWRQESQGLLEHVDVSLLKEVRNNLPEKLDHSHKRELPSFTELNEEGIEDNSNLQKSCLESPTIVNPFTVTSNEPWSELQPLMVGGAECQGVLQPKKKQVLEKSLWFYQKFLDNILIQRLKEPDVRGALCERTTFKDVWRAMDLTPELCDELHLPWVPVDYTDLAQAGAEGVEPYAKGAKIIHKDINECVKEDFTKHNLQSHLCERDTAYSLPDARGTLHALDRKEMQEQNNGTGDGLPTLKSFSPRKPSDGAAFGPPPDPTDPLDGFMWMKQRPRKPRGRVGHQIVSATESGRPSADKNAGEQISQKDVQNNISPLNKKDGTGAITAEVETVTPLVNSVDIVRVEMSGDYLAPAVRLREAARPLLQSLQSDGLLPPNQTLAALTPAITRFILKQHNKSCDMARESAQSPDQAEIPEHLLEIYKRVVGLHALVDALHCLLHGCLPLAAARMAEAHQRYGALPTALTRVRQDLFETHVSSEQRHVRHPKVLVLCERLIQWVKATGQGEQENNRKVLVVLNHGSSCLANSVKEGLMMVNGLQPDICPSQGELIVTDVMNSLAKHNCVIVCGAQITADFPLARFFFVVEYEHKQGSRLEEYSTKEKITYLGLEMDTNNVFKEEPSDLGTSSATLKPSRAEIILIGSQNVTKDTQLLHFLEARNNIMVLERDYQTLLGGRPRPAFADFTVDESVCVVLQDLSELGEVRAASPLVLRLTQLSHKYNKCWLLLHAPPSSTKKYLYAGMVPSTLARLHAGITHLLSLVRGYDIQVLHSKSAEHTADLVRQIADEAWSASTTWKREEWLNRTWISPVMSKHERFLLGIPYINTFSAQILLKAIPVNKLPNLSVQELVNYCPWIAKERLQGFWKCLHRKREEDPKATCNAKKGIDQDIAPGTNLAPAWVSESMDSHKGGSEYPDAVYSTSLDAQRAEERFYGALNSFDIEKDVTEQESIAEPLVNESGELAVPNEYERACWEHQAFSTGGDGTGEQLLQKPLSELRQELPEDSFERELNIDRILGADLKSTFPEDVDDIEYRSDPMQNKRLAVDIDKLLLPDMYPKSLTQNKRSSQMSRFNYDGVPLKLPKVDSSDQSFDTSSDERLKHKEPSLPYPESQTSEKYRDYSNRKSLNLWTRFGDPQEKPSGYQSQRTKSGAVDVLLGRGQRGVPVHRQTTTHSGKISESYDLNNYPNSLNRSGLLHNSSEGLGYNRSSDRCLSEGRPEATKFNHTKDFQQTFTRSEIFGQGRKRDNSSASGSYPRHFSCGFARSEAFYENSRMSTRNLELISNDDEILGTISDVPSKNPDVYPSNRGYNTPNRPTSVPVGPDNPGYPSCSLMPFTPKWSGSGRGIAPVTPKVRVPVRTLQLGEGRTDHEHEGAATSTWGGNQDNSYTAPKSVSPPMDLSQEDLQQEFYLNKLRSDQQVPQTVELFQQFGVGQSSFSDQVYSREEKAPRQRKLTYEKIPGAPKGQTRLSFV